MTLGKTTGKKQLAYASIDELDKACKSGVDMKTLDYNKPAICNSLLKMFDKGNEYLRDEDDERAYIMFVRFFEGFMILRKSRIYKDDAKFVDGMISINKLNQTMTLLERLKDELKARYEEKTNGSKQSDAKDSATVAESSAAKKEEISSKEKVKSSSSSFIDDKKSLDPKELITVIKEARHRVLIIDVRSKLEFDSSHMSLNLILTEEKQRTNFTYINVPTECVQSVAWNIQDALRGVDPTSASIFADRLKFDYIVVFDADSRLEDTLSQHESKLGMFKRAIFDYDQEACKNEPIVLEGGWRHWIAYYPTLVSNLSNSNGGSGGGDKQSKTTDKMFNIEYPELFDKTKAKTVPQVKPVQSQSTVTAPVIPPSEVRLEPVLNQEPPKSEAPRNEPPSSQPQQQQQQPASNKSIPQQQEAKSDASVRPIERPTFDRSIKPEKEKENKPIDSTPAAPSAPQPQVQQPANPPTLNPTSPNTPSTVSSQIPTQNNATYPNTLNTTKPSTQKLSDSSPKTIGASLPKAPTSKMNSNNNVDEMIYNQVYAPMRSNKPIQTPYMQEGSTKVLDSTTGLFSYNPPTANNKPTPTVTATTVTPTQPQQAFKPPQSQQQQQQATNRPKIPPQKPAKNIGGSNLKRTISQPNIAKLDDDELIESLHIDESNEKRAIIQSLNQNEFGKIETKPVSIKPTTEPATVGTKQPAVNRNSKPMPEHVMLARIEDLQPVYGNAHAGLTGIRNLGNTCFMNSIIQCLASSERLVNYFMTGQHRNDLNRYNELGFRGEIADEFSVIVRAMWGGMCRIIAPRRFKYIIGQFNQQFVSNEQQDSQELLLFLLDGLHEDLNRVKSRPKLSNKEDENENLSDQEMANLAWKTHLSINNSIIVDLFQGQFKSTVTCLSCQKKSVKFDAFMYLTLPLPSQKCDIYDCLELFLKPERMSGESKWKCPKCKEYRDAVKKIDIWSLPPLLIIHLKRFKYHGLWRDKITTHVDYPIENLNLDRYAMSRRVVDKSSTSNNYRLYAVSNHSGTLDGGHYTALCRHIEYGRWFKFDDSEVKDISNSASAIRSPLSYILFYSRS